MSYFSLYLQFYDITRYKQFMYYYFKCAPYYIIFALPLETYGKPIKISYLHFIPYSKARGWNTFRPEYNSYSLSGKRTLVPNEGSNIIILIGNLTLSSYAKLVFEHHVLLFKVLSKYYPLDVMTILFLQRLAVAFSIKVLEQLLFDEQSFMSTMD